MSYRGTSSALVGDLGMVLPEVAEQEGSTGQAMGVQRHFSVAIGPPTLADSTTYKHALFVAPCDGCYIKEIWVSAAVPIAGGTNTLAFDNYDASANASRNVLSATTFDPTGITAKEGTKMTLTSTATDLLMDEGDVLNCTLVTDLQTTAGEGYVVTIVVVVPEIL